MLVLHVLLSLSTPSLRRQKHTGAAIQPSLILIVWFLLAHRPKMISMPSET
jgi:hypothetical protein